MNSIIDKRTIDGSLLVEALRGSLSIQTHLQLLVWLQSEVGTFVPHDVLISYSAATGDESPHYDIVSTVPGVRTVLLPHDSLKVFLGHIRQLWIDGGFGAGSCTFENGLSGKTLSEQLPAPLSGMKQAMFHATIDSRFNAQYLYILLRYEKSFSGDEQQLFELILPHIDAAVRKIEKLPMAVDPAKLDTPEIFQSVMLAGLSPREIEILTWVRNGKTNIEIGRILDISSNTVKNHLQRVFRKINVSNRAQAVGLLKGVALPQDRGWVGRPEESTPA